MASSSSSSRSCDYDVFLSFRGEDTRKIFVDCLYYTLDNRGIFTYKDDETLTRGESIHPALLKAIEGSQIAVIVFSENYADSSWCLDELEHIMKCRDEGKVTVIPIFYGVVPSDVRKQEGHFGKGFAIQVARNNSKVDLWRKALVDASNISGWEPKNMANGHEMEAINEIVNTISEKVLSFTSNVDKDFVGMEVRLKKLEAELDLKSSGVRMVGIWGVGGGGKTTLATSLCLKISPDFQGHFIVENIRVKSAEGDGLKALQEKLLFGLLRTKTMLQSVSHGKLVIESRLSRRKVLIILDDVDDIVQLDALAGSCNWFGSGSRIIITTRNEHLLISHKEVQVFPVTLLSRQEARQLLKKRAYNKTNPLKDYDTLSSRVVSYAAGLPLALRVIGSFLCGKNEEEWRCALARLENNPDMEIVEILKISYDGLKPLEKQLFLDIACFFRWETTLEAMEMFEACGYHPGIGITVLRQKALITIIDGKFNMHDLVQEMAHYIVKGDYPENPENHSRVWETENIEYLLAVTKENDKIEVIEGRYDSFDGSLFYKMISNMKILRCLTAHNHTHVRAEGPSFLSNDLRYIDWAYCPRTPFPDCFQPMKLVHLKLTNGVPKELWKGYKHLPHLKVLKLNDMRNLLHTPDFNGLPCLQKLELYGCIQLTEIHPSLGEHTSLEEVRVSFCYNLRMFPMIVQMGKLKTLKIKCCHESLEFPEIKSNMESLLELSLRYIGIDALLSSIGEQCANLTSLHLIGCFYSKIVEANFDGLKHLKDFAIPELKYTQMTLGDVVPSRDGCGISFQQLKLCFQKLKYTQMPLGDRIPSRHVCGSQISIWLRPLFPQLTLSLQKLNLYGCNLRDDEIPSDIGELSNLRELDLSRNSFTRLHFCLSQLTQLKLLNLSWCQLLIEFPELPSRLAFLKAEGCLKLKAIGDLKDKCKRLCRVLLGRGSTINDGSRLLESMLQENANDHNMLLQLKGFEIAKGFISPLRRGREYRLQLPENWHNDFSGFLICCVRRFVEFLALIHVSGMEFEDDIEEETYSDDVKEETCIDDEVHTEVWYISFASLRDTAWWKSTYIEVLFYCSGVVDELGVGLVPRKSGSCQTQTSTPQEESEFSKYTPFDITYDSANILDISLSLYR